MQLATGNQAYAEETIQPEQTNNPLATETIQTEPLTGERPAEPAIEEPIQEAVQPQEVAQQEVPSQTETIEGQQAIKDQQTIEDQQTSDIQQIEQTEVPSNNAISLMSVSEPEATQPAPAKPIIEVVKRDGSYYYMENGQVAHLASPRLVKISNDYYFVDSNGKVSTDVTYVPKSANGGYVAGNALYAFGADGKMIKASGLRKVGNKWYYHDSRWALIQNKVVKNGNDFYLTDGDGCLLRDGNYQVSSAAAGSGVKAGFYHINADGTMEVSRAKTEIRGAIGEYTHYIAFGKGNSIEVRLFYRGAKIKGADKVYAQAAIYNSAGQFVGYEERPGKLSSNGNGSFTMRLDGLAPNNAYKLALATRFVDEKRGSKVLKHRDQMETGKVFTLSKNTYPIYSNAKARNKIKSAFIRGKSAGKMYIKISKNEYDKLRKDKIDVNTILTSKLTADNEKQMGSLFEACLLYDINQLDTWKNGKNHYLGLNAISLSKATHLKNYKKMTSWYNKAKKKAAITKSAKQKVKILAKYLMDHCSYGWQNHSKAGDPVGGDPGKDDIGVVLYGKAICDGYASTFKKMCIYTGIKCEYIASNNHAWNLVKIGKKWYHYDTTWNDCVKSQKAFSFMGRNKANQEKEYRSMKVSKTFLKQHPIAAKSLKW